MQISNELDDPKTQKKEFTITTIHCPEQWISWMPYNKIVGVKGICSINGRVYHCWMMGATFLTTDCLVSQGHRRNLKQRTLKIRR
jgi:hypothetical protein